MTQLCSDECCLIVSTINLQKVYPLHSAFLKMCIAEKDQGCPDLGCLDRVQEITVHETVEIMEGMNKPQFMALVIESEGTNHVV